MSDASDLLCLVYVSRAARAISPDDLLLLLRQARSHNAARGISGLLLYKDGRFMQALEGPRAPVLDLYGRILADPRHRDVTTLIRFQIEGRAFDGWSMGFADLGSIPAEDRVTLSPFLADDFTPAAWSGAPHRAITLLTAFREAGRERVSLAG